MIEAKVLFDEEAARMLSRVSVRTNKRSRISRTILGVCGAVLILCGISLILLRMGRGAAAMLSGWIYLLLGCFLAYYTIWGVYRLSWKMTLKKNAKISQLHYVFTEKNIHSDTPLTSSDVSWQMVKRVTEVEDWMVLEAGNGYILLQEQDLVQGTMAALRQMVAQCAPQALRR